MKTFDRPWKIRKKCAWKPFSIHEKSQKKLSRALDFHGKKKTLHNVGYVLWNAVNIHRNAREIYQNTKEIPYNLNEIHLNTREMH